MKMLSSLRVVAFVESGALLLALQAFSLLISMPFTSVVMVQGMRAPSAMPARNLQECFVLATDVQYYCHKNPRDNMDAVLVEYVETETTPAGTRVYEREDWVEKHASKKAKGITRDRIKTIAKVKQLLLALAADATQRLHAYSAALPAADPRLWEEAKEPVRRLQVSRNCLNARSALVARRDCKGVLDVVFPMSVGEKKRHDIGDVRLLEMRDIIAPALQEFETAKAEFRSRAKRAAVASQKVLELRKHLFDSPGGPPGSESDSDTERERQEAEKLRQFRQSERQKFLEEQQRAETERNRNEAARRKQQEEEALRTAFKEAGGAGQLRAPTADENRSHAEVLDDLVDNRGGFGLPNEVLQRKDSPLTDDEKKELQVTNGLPISK